MKLEINTEREALLLYEAVKRKYNFLKDSLEMQNFVSNSGKKQLAEYAVLLDKISKFYSFFITKAGDYDPVKFTS